VLDERPIASSTSVALSVMLSPLSLLRALQLRVCITRSSSSVFVYLSASMQFGNACNKTAARRTALAIQ
jgi:hypothetical protein